MARDLFKSLPQDLRIEILSRLPIDAIGKCKCVSKAWRELIEGSAFATWHRSRWTDSCVAVAQDTTSSKPYKIFAFNGADSSTRPITTFGFPRSDDYNELTLDSSVNGLLLLFDEGVTSPTFLICNPITREYVELPTPPRFEGCRLITLGFGVSRVSGQYKVVMIFDRHSSDDVECGVYDLGLGLWRRVAIREDWCISSSYTTEAAFSNGNLHFLVKDDDDDDLKVVACFDLETELFTVSFPAPRGYGGELGGLRVLDGRLSLFDHSSKDEICIWSMRRYGDGNSWAKEYAIGTPQPTFYGEKYRTILFPIKVFKDGGDILFGVVGCNDLYIYSNRTKVIREYGFLPLHMRYTWVVVYTPTFLSLKTIGIQGCDVEAF